MTSLISYQDETSEMFSLKLLCLFQPQCTGKQYVLNVSWVIAERVSEGA